MRPISPDLTDELIKHVKYPSRVGYVAPYRVDTFRQLVEQTAKLSFRNKDYLLFYRGQTNDFKNKAGKSTYYPTIYRTENLPRRDLEKQFDLLEESSKQLIKLFEKNKTDGLAELKYHKSIQWSLLQHYEVCATPLLDFTHSLRVACSFATLDKNSDTACVSVFGMPYFTNRISRNSEHDIINVRLLSICPPQALRPFFQEGYLIGTDDVTTNFDSKTDLDFNNRLIAKFAIPNNSEFWKDSHVISYEDLYPINDPIKNLCDQILQISIRELKPGLVGEFLQLWAELENNIFEIGRNKTQRNISLGEAIKVISKSLNLTADQIASLDKLRRFRNILVHTPHEVDPTTLREYLTLLEFVRNDLNI
jgi:hypothetical protein